MSRLLAISWAATTLLFATVAVADAPSVRVTYPTTNMTISLAATPSIRFQVAVADSDEAVFIVGYYVCQASGSACASPPVIAGTVSAPPFEFVWTPPSVLSDTGATTPYRVWAEAQNVFGQAQQSTPVAFTVLQPAPGPSVKLISPDLPSEYVSPAAPVLYATAWPGNTSPPSSIVRVDFLDGGETVASLKSSNAVPSGYAYVWRTVQHGEHLVSVRAVDSLGNSNTSTAVLISVVDKDKAPEVKLTSPHSGDVYAPSAVVQLAATATSEDGLIERVEFIAGNTVIATARSSPYTATWTNPSPGNFAIVARAFDDLGVMSASQAAYVQVLETPRAPLVVLTAPTSGATLSAVAPLSLMAAALSPDGGIGQVDFYAGTTLLGSATTSPYTFSWLTPQVGSQLLSAKVRDLTGKTAASSIVRITITSALVPSIAVTAPASGSTFTLPTVISVGADASESGGAITKVEFYANGNLIGSKTSAPFSIAWSNPPAGGYSLLAKATDNAGMVATSASVPVTVLSPSPTVALTAPLDGARFASGQSIALVANATTPGTTISKVDFECDGSIIGTITPNGSASSGTYTLNWSGAVPGGHVISAKVLAANGATIASTSIGINVAAIAVELTAPFVGEVFQAATPISLAATASEPSGAIAKVEFYADGALIGTSTNAPFNLRWLSASAGTHSLTARAYDSSGLSATSHPSSVTVIATPSIQLDAGIDGATIPDDNATISGVVQAPLNSAVTINGRQAVLDLTGRFFVEGLKLNFGANTVSVNLNAQGSAPLSKTLSINATGPAPFEVTLDKQQGIAPLTVNLSISNRGNVAFKRIDIDTTDDGVPDLALTALTSSGTTQSITYGSPGVYTLRIVVYDANDHPIYSATRRVRAIDPSELGYRLANVYTTLVDNLASNNVSAALTAFVDGARDRYSSVFAALGASLPGIAGQLGKLSNIVVMEDMGELAVARTVGSDTQVFMIYLIRGNDGVWRIETM